MPTDTTALILALTQTIDKKFDGILVDVRALQTNMVTKDEMFRSHNAIAQTVSEIGADMKKSLQDHVCESMPRLEAVESYVEKQKITFGVVKPWALFFVGILSSVITTFISKIL